VLLNDRGTTVFSSSLTAEPSRFPGWLLLIAVLAMQLDVPAAGESSSGLGERMEHKRTWAEARFFHNNGGSWRTVLGKLELAGRVLDYFDLAALWLAGPVFVTVIDAVFQPQPPTSIRTGCASFIVRKIRMIFIEQP